MTDYRLAGPARRSMVEILRHSAAAFGPQARDRYAALFAQAMNDVAVDPGRAGVVGAAGVAYTAQPLPSQTRLPTGCRSSRTPRHVLVLSVDADGIVDVLGVIHERMLIGPALLRIIRNQSEKAP